MHPIRKLMVPSILALLCSLSLPAQTLPPGSGQIAHIEGKVYLDQQPVEASNTPVWILNRNSVVRTEEGRAEILLAGGVFLFLGENSAVKRVPSDGYHSSRFEVLSGSTVVTTGEMGSVAKCENEVTLSDSGRYRFDVPRLPAELSSERLCGLKVYEGAAAVRLASVISLLRGRQVHKPESPLRR
jgi:hypothetical protein